MSSVYQRLGDKQGHYSGKYDDLSEKEKKEIDVIAKARLREQERLRNIAKRKNEDRKKYNEAKSDVGKMILYELNNLLTKWRSNWKTRNQTIDKIDALLDENQDRLNEKNLTNDEDKTALHLAFESLCPLSVIKKIANACPMAFQSEDRKGMLPIHLAANPCSSIGSCIGKERFEVNQRYEENLKFCLETDPQGAKTCVAKYPNYYALHYVCKRYEDQTISARTNKLNTRCIEMVLKAFPEAAQCIADKKEDVKRLQALRDGVSLPPIPQWRRLRIPVNIACGSWEFREMFLEQQTKPSRQPYIRLAKDVLLAYSPKDYEVRKDGVCTGCIVC